MPGIFWVYFPFGLQFWRTVYLLHYPMDDLGFLLAFTPLSSLCKLAVIPLSVCNKSMPMEMDP